MCGCAGLVVFFRALTGGAMAAAAPVTAVVSASLPVLAGVGAISRAGGPAARFDRRTLGLAVTAGVGFGLFAGVALALLAVGLIASG